MWCSQLGLQTDVAQDDHLVVGGRVLKCPRKQRDRIFVVSGEELLIGAHDTLGCLLQPLPVRIVSGPLDQRANGGLRLGPARPAARPRLDA